MAIRGLLLLKIELSCLEELGLFIPNWPDDVKVSASIYLSNHFRFPTLEGSNPSPISSTNASHYEVLPREPELRMQTRLRAATPTRPESGFGSARIPLPEPQPEIGGTCLRNLSTAGALHGTEKFTPNNRRFR